MADGIDALCYEFGAGKSAIREQFERATKLKESGAENIYDFSIGNPYVDAPPEVNESIVHALELPSVDLHGYTANRGLTYVREAIATDLRQRFGGNYSADDLVLTAGASGALTSTICALTSPGEEVIVLTPYYPEYRMFIQAWHCKCIPVATQPTTFQPDVDAIERAITPCTRMVIVNSPNNPTGAIYDEQILRDLGAMLRRKSAELDKTIYLLSDEPYREIVYDGRSNPWVAGTYSDTIVCYSYSKSLSIAGERAGYVLVPRSVINHDRVIDAILGAQRVVNTIMPSIIQRVVGECVGAPAPMDAYTRKRGLIYEGLARIGYEVVHPDGAFYLWMRALEPDEDAFSDRAFEHGLLLVASNDFGIGGYERLSYCVADETLAGCLPAFQELWDDYGGYTW
ncbi:MAG: pyridoxal phosphate-dependent aminotransferase [Atopobiaceae bacterium]|jgi:aspartate aminotransferase|nr:pyridoxal phosphate-dependent aminotransferase [Atopobiaceae bacterium]MCI2173874.1 pyridoxal phosphate-dependent aminotransferase [Atopobiaceae bacterium]MCI2208036.1 pyridoxal phosphate-dependent aminotransferase [Atopobiaceae bacterium]